MNTQVNLRNRKQNNGISVFDMGAGKHHGPIYSIQRNPAQNKYFMTVSTATYTSHCYLPIICYCSSINAV
jgi:hypothetical protein